MGRKRKEDVILDLLPSSDRDPSGPGTSNRAPKRANNPQNFSGADVRGFERPTSDIMREYVNLLMAGLMAMTALLTSGRVLAPNAYFITDEARGR